MPKFVPFNTLYLLNDPTAQKVLESFQACDAVFEDSPVARPSDEQDNVFFNPEKVYASSSVSSQLGWQLARAMSKNRRFPDVVVAATPDEAVLAQWVTYHLNGLLIDYIRQSHHSLRGNIEMLVNKVTHALPDEVIMMVAKQNEYGDWHLDKHFQNTLHQKTCFIVRGVVVNRRASQQLTAHAQRLGGTVLGEGCLILQASGEDLYVPTQSNLPAPPLHSLAVIKVPLFSES